MDPELAEAIRCPRCGGKDVRDSYPKPFLDAFMTLLGLRPFRCRFCRHRYYKRLLPGQTVGMPGEPESGRQH